VNIKGLEGGKSMDESLTTGISANASDEVSANVINEVNTNANVGDEGKVNVGGGFEGGFEWENASTNLEGTSSEQTYQYEAEPNFAEDFFAEGSLPNGASNFNNPSDPSDPNDLNDLNGSKNNYLDPEVNLDFRDDVVAETYKPINVGNVSNPSNLSNAGNAGNAGNAPGSNVSSEPSHINVSADSSYPEAYPETYPETNLDSVIDRNLIDNSAIGKNGVIGANAVNSANDKSANNANAGGQENSGNNSNNKSVPVLDEENDIENNLPLSQPQTAMQRARAKIAPGGDTSKRVVGVAIFAIVVLLVIWGGAGKKQNEASDNNKAQGLRPIPIEKSNLGNTLNSPEIGQSVNSQSMSRGNEEVASNASPNELPPPVIIPAPPPAPPPLGGGDIPIVVNEPVKVEKQQRQYAFQLRAGQQVMKAYDQQQVQLQTQQSRKEEVGDGSRTRVISRGTTIPMMMIQPFRNDLPGVVKCQVTVDVKDNKGALLIPAGSVASVPFAPFRNNKRVFNRVDSPTSITLSDGREIELKGTVIDRKGFVGLEGKVRRSGDAAFGKRVGRTMARVLTFGLASSVGGVGGGVISEAGNSSIDSSYSYTATTGSYVELPIGTTFIFSVSGN
jgi:type IV secretory pathway VirB10-like protein